MRNFTRVILLSLLLAGCGGGGGGTPPIIVVEYEAECTVLMNGLCCFDDEYVVHNGLDSICVEPSTVVVWDGHALYLEDK